MVSIYKRISKLPKWQLTLTAFTVLCLGLTGLFIAQSSPFNQAKALSMLVNTVFSDDFSVPSMQPIGLCSSNPPSCSFQTSVQKNSLYFGNPQKMNYDGGNLKTVGQYQYTNGIDVPATNISTLNIQQSLEVEKNPVYDKATITISEISNPNNKLTIDAKTQLPNQNSDNNIYKIDKSDLHIDISQFNGKKIALYFAFDSVDTVMNQYRGWEIQSLSITNNGQSSSTSSTTSSSSTSSSTNYSKSLVWSLQANEQDFIFQPLDPNKPNLWQNSSNYAASSSNQGYIDNALPCYPQSGASCLQSSTSSYSPSSSYSSAYISSSVNSSTSTVYSSSYYPSSSFSSSYYTSSGAGVINCFAYPCYPNDYFLYYGKNDTSNYDTGRLGNGGVAISKPISVSTNTEYEFNMGYLLDVEKDSNYDKVEISFVGDKTGTIADSVKNKDQLVVEKAPHNIVYKFNSGENTNIQLKLKFDTVDNVANASMGWKIFLGDLFSLSGSDQGNQQTLVWDPYTCGQKNVMPITGTNGLCGAWAKQNLSEAQVDNLWNEAINSGVVCNPNITKDQPDLQYECSRDPYIISYHKFGHSDYNNNNRNGGSILSPVINLTNLSGQNINLEIENILDVENMPDYDQASIHIVPKQICPVNPQIQCNSLPIPSAKIWSKTYSFNNYEKELINISQYVSSPFQLEFRFDTKDRFANSTAGWNIKNINIYSNSSGQVLPICQPGVYSTKTNPCTEIPCLPNSVYNYQTGGCSPITCLGGSSSISSSVSTGCGPYPEPCGGSTSSSVQSSTQQPSCAPDLTPTKTTTIQAQGASITFDYLEATNQITYYGNVFGSNGCSTLQSQSLDKNNAKYTLKYSINQKADMICTQVAVSIPVSGNMNVKLTQAELDNFNSLFDIIKL